MICSIVITIEQITFTNVLQLVKVICSIVITITTTLFLQLQIVLNHTAEVCVLLLGQSGI